MYKSSNSTVMDAGSCAADDWLSLYTISPRHDQTAPVLSGVSFKEYFVDLITLVTFSSNRFRSFTDVEVHSTVHELTTMMHKVNMGVQLYSTANSDHTDPV